MTVTISGIVTGATAHKDSRPWKVFSPVYREGTDGTVVTTLEQTIRVTGGAFSVEVEPGPVVLVNPNGDRYSVTVPNVDVDLWELIEAAAAFTPATAAGLMESAITQYLIDHPIGELINDQHLVPDSDPRLDDHRIPVTGSVTSESLDPALATELAVRGTATTVTAAGTTTLTIASAMVQIFTGSTTQTVKLPTTSVTAGLQYVVINQSSGRVTVQSSAGNTVGVLTNNRVGLFTAIVDTPTAAAQWSVMAPSPSLTEYTTVQRDLYGNSTFNNVIAVPTSTATAAGTTTLTIASSQVQVFTGSTTQSVLLPTTSVLAGQVYIVCNQSSGAVTVKSSDTSSVVVLASGRVGVFTAAVNTPTTAANWVAVAPSTSALYGGTGVVRDSNTFVQAGGVYVPTNTIATAGGTTTLTLAFGATQVFTGSANQTVKLPTSGVPAGMQITIINQSSGTVTVQSSAANTITTVSSNSGKLFMALATTPTTDAHWRAI